MQRNITTLILVLLFDRENQPGKFPEVFMLLSKSLYTWHGNLNCGKFYTKNIQKMLYPNIHLKKISMKTMSVLTKPEWQATLTYCLDVLL